MSPRGAYLRIVPPNAEFDDRITPSKGTQVFLAGQPVKGVTKVELTAEVGQPWRAVIHCHVIPPEEVAVSGMRFEELPSFIMTNKDGK